MKKRIISMMLALMLLNILSLFVGANEEYDFERLGSITITMTYRSRPISGGTLTLYHVADIVSDNGNISYAYTDDFDECEIPLTDIDSADLADALADIAIYRNRTGTSRTIGRNGKAVFSDLELGLYLIVQTKASPGFYRIMPFLVSVPLAEDGQLIYDVDTEPKTQPTPIPDIPEETEPEETEPEETEPEETEPGETEPEETEPKETEPGETEPEESEPEETEPEETEPEESEPEEIEPEESDPEEIEPEETDPEETEPEEEPEEEELPQTGLYNWPIPVLAVTGMIFIAVGLFMRSAGKKKYEE